MSRGPGQAGQQGAATSAGGRRVRGHRAQARPPVEAGPRRARAGAAAALAVALGVAGGLWPAPAEARPGPGPTLAPAPAISPATLEARHGLRVTRVAVSGGGGLVDLRFTIVDPAKARPLLEGAGHDLRLVVEPDGATLTAPHHGAMRNVRLAKDAACFVLFPNARGAVRPGRRVAVAFGDVRLQAVAAQ